jgi:hypothetical protein
VAGGATYTDNVNKLSDDLNAPGTGGLTFTALGVRKGDIVVIDPCGVIPRKGGLPAVSESGFRPLGDDGVSVRGIDYTAKLPSPLDDNRGFYRVIEVVDSVTPPYLLVNPVTEVSGLADDPVIFAETDVTRAYAVYPTVNASTLSPTWQEAQMALRPTRARNAVTGSFKTYPDGPNRHSIRPFAYSVYRPSGFFQASTIDLVLFMRERMLSLIEMLRQIGTNKTGSYFRFQAESHLSEVGSLLFPELGLGIASNAYLGSVLGRVAVMPFANNTSCLSLLDRRFWILDDQLDSLTYDSTTGFGMRRAGPGDTPYTEYNTTAGSLVRPVLPDLVDQVLEDTERLRDTRFVWLAYRTHKVLGTLASIARLETEMPTKLAEQEKLLLLEKSMEKV